MPMKNHIAWLSVLLVGIIGKTEAQEAYPAATGWEYMLHPGTAVLEGQVTDSRTGGHPKTFTVRVENMFKGDEQQVLVRTDENGVFRTEIALPHPQFVYVDNVDFVFLFPGDTLRCHLQTGNGKQEFTGDGTAAQVNRKWQELSSRYFKGIPLPHEVYRREKAEVWAYRNTLVQLIDRFAKEIRRGTPPEWEVESPVVADVLKTLVLEEAFRRIVEVGYAYQNRGHQQPDKPLDALDEKKFFGFLKKRQALLLDNPLMLCASTQWVLFNRLEFWGIGCAPCRTGMLGQRKLVEEMKEMPIRFLYLCQDKRSVAEEFLHKNDIRGEHIFLTPDEWNYLSAKFGFSAIPFQIVIDRQGNIHPHPASVPTRESLEEYINR